MTQITDEEFKAEQARREALAKEAEKWKGTAKEAPYVHTWEELVAKTKELEQRIEALESGGSD